MKTPPAFKGNFKKIFESLAPSPEIGGLEVSDSAIRFVKVAGGFFKSSLRLPPGIVADGKILDKPAFVNALKKLRESVGFSKKLYVVVSIETTSVYVSRFGLPEIPERELKEAIWLNLQTISPMKMEDAYADWQTIGGEPVDGFQTEFLGGFISKELVDDLAECLNKARFVLAAVEFPALSLARLVKEAGAGLDLSRPQLIINASAAGLVFVILKNGSLYFQHFRPWRDIYGEARQVSAALFEENVKAEIFKVLNFYSTKAKREITDVVLIATGLIGELSGIIKKNFSIEPRVLVLDKFSDFEQDWFRVLGAALRGTLPRSEDNFMSLMSVNIREEFERGETFLFISVWRSAFVASLAFTLFSFLVADVFLTRHLDFYRETIRRNKIEPPTAKVEVRELEEEAAKFNLLVASLEAAKKDKQRWSPLLAKLEKLKGGIVLDRIFIQSVGAPVILSGRGKSEEEVLDFKNSLSRQPQFSDVTLPLAGIAKEVSGEFAFNLTFNIKNLDF